MKISLFPPSHVFFVLSKPLAGHGSQTFLVRLGHRHSCLTWVVVVFHLITVPDNTIGDNLMGLPVSYFNCIYSLSPNST